MGTLAKPTYPDKLLLFSKAQKMYFCKPKCTAELSNQIARWEKRKKKKSSWCGMYIVLIKKEEFKPSPKAL